MSGQSQGLTSIRDNKSLVSRVIDNNKFDKMEVFLLNRQKQNLLKKTKELLDFIGLLKENKKAFVKGYEEFGSERLSFLSEVGRLISDDLSQQADSLSAKSSQLLSLEEFLSDLSEYLSAYADICESDRLTNASRSVDMVSEALIIANDMKEAEKSLSLGRQKLAEADNKLTLTNNRYQEADRLTKFIENVADRERKILLDWEKGLRLRELSLNALDKTKIRLKKKEEWLDKEKVRLQEMAEKLRSNTPK